MRIDIAHPIRKPVLLRPCPARTAFIDEDLESNLVAEVRRAAEVLPRQQRLESIPIGRRFPNYIRGNMTARGRLTILEVLKSRRLMIRYDPGDTIICERSVAPGFAAMINSTASSR